MVGALLGMTFTDRLTQDWGEEAALHVETPSMTTLFSFGAVAASGKSVPPLQLLRLSF